MTVEVPEDGIVSAILDAVAEQRLPAGTKLAETALAEMFSCNRANVRRALASLAAQQVVDLIPNRGAFVVTPSPKQARDVFQARRAIERVISREAVAHVTPTDITLLRQNVAAEVEAKHRRDRPTELRLSRQFHQEIARIAGNQVMDRILADLTMRSTLIIGLYGQDTPSCCAEQDHSAIVDALEAGHVDTVADLMDNHLRHIESQLDFSARKPLTSRLHDQILGGSIAVA